MIISERQIMYLLTIARNNIETLKMLARTNGIGLSKERHQELINNLLFVEEITNQQSEELKDFKDE